MTVSTLLLLLAAGPVVVPEPAAPSPAATNQPSSPVFAVSGYVKPAEVEKHCVANAVRLPRQMAGIDGTITSKFAVEADGSTSHYEALSEAPGEVIMAIRQAVKLCKFTPGLDPQGRPVSMWVILPIRFQGDPNPQGSPHQAEHGCIDNQLKYRFPPNRLLHGQLAVRVAISAEGKVGAIQFPPGLPDDVINAFTLSIQGCTLLPAVTAEGTPTEGTFVYRVDFGQPGAGGRAAGDGPKLKREAKLVSTTCLQRLKPFGVIGHAVVRVTVTPEGEPTNFRLEPQNLPADLRTQIVDVLSMCKWGTALDLEDRPVAGDTEVIIRYR